MTASPSPDIAARRRETLALAAALAALKLALLAFDPTLRFFLGDSASYLHSALTGWIPPDRSFVYGYLLRGSAVAAHSAWGVLLLQSLFGIVASCLVFRLLRDAFAASRAIAAACALLLALEPAQLFYERMLMAESAGTLAFVAMLYAGFAWLARPRWIWALAWPLAGIVAVSLRMSLLPVVLGFALLPPLVALLARAPVSHGRLAAHALMALAATLALHKGYQRWYGHLYGARPDYIADSGYFRLGLVAPLVTPEEARRAGLPDDFLARVRVPLADPRAREAQLWLPDGLIARIREIPNFDGNRAARKLAGYALRGDPAGFLRLSWLTVGDYFDAEVVRARMEDDLGTRPLEANTLDELRSCCEIDGRGVEAQRNPIARWFAASTPWLTFCFLALLPLALAALIANWRRARAAALLLATGAAGLVLAQALFSHIVSFRYLHPFPPLLLLAAGALFAALSRKPATPGDGDRSTSASWRN